MTIVQAAAARPLGHFEFEVYGAGRSQCMSQFKMRCDAIALHESELLLLSVVGAETAVKATTAGLQSSARDQKRLTFTARVGDVNATSLGPVAKPALGLGQLGLA